MQLVLRDFSWSWLAWEGFLDLGFLSWEESGSREVGGDDLLIPGVVVAPVSVFPGLLPQGRCERRISRLLKSPRSSEQSSWGKVLRCPYTSERFPFTDTCHLGCL